MTWKESLRVAIALFLFLLPLGAVLFFAVVVSPHFLWALPVAALISFGVLSFVPASWDSVSLVHQDDSRMLVCIHCGGVVTTTSYEDHECVDTYIARICLCTRCKKN